MRSLEGKSIVVTGAGAGLGRAYSLAIAAEGGSVLAFDLDGEAASSTAEEINGRGGKALAASGSVADPEAVEYALNAASSAFGRIDGLVNNAGINYEARPWDESPDQIRRIVDVNLVGVLLFGTQASRRMAEGSAIVNISSGASFGQEHVSTYAATKGAVASVTYSWALDLEERGIRVNALSPLAYTAMVQMPVASQAMPKDRSPELITPVLVWLLSDRAAGVTGQFFRFSGNELHVVGQPFVKEPVVHRDEWDVDEVDAVMTGTLRAALERYGMVKRIPPVLR